MTPVFWMAGWPRAIQASEKWLCPCRTQRGDSADSLMKARRHSWLRGFALAGILTLTACGSSSDGTRVVRRDSAGVAIVETHAPRWRNGSPWKVATEPLLDLGTVLGDSAHEFGSVIGAVRLRDGGFAVADQASEEIRFFSSDGAFLGSVGGQGEGPGEFGSLTSLEPFGDSLVAFDLGLNRVSFVDVHRRVVTRIMPLPLHIVSGVQALGDSALVLDAASLGVLGAHGRFGIRYDAVLISPRGAVLDTLLTEPGPYDYRFQMSGGGYLDARPLFAKIPRFAAGEDVLYGGSARRMEIDAVALSRGGVKRRIVRVPGYDLSLRPGQVEAERKVLNSYDPSPLKERVLSEMPAPTSRPAYDKLLVDSLGYLWAEVGRGASEWDEAESWNIFSPDGEWLGALRLPPHFDPFEIGADWILGNQPDSLDVDHPVLLRLTRAH